MNDTPIVKNKYRALLTEMLPYEIPLLLDNSGFYYNMLDEKLRAIFNHQFSFSNTWTIPFNYTIKKNGGIKSRLLSIMHPKIQLDFVDLYEHYELLMIHLCNISPYSLRHIHDVAKCTFNLESAEKVIDKEEKIVELEDEIQDKEVPIYRSYFTYRTIDMIFKFHQQMDLLRLEQKFHFMMNMDIASCFYHIYTHSIAWAIKGKECAKNNIDTISFETTFDKLMQRSNYNETNGILVGPEVSRIFAEIIFQRIDLNVLNILREKNLKLGSDYEIRRYVDDHFIFANKKETLSLILDVFKEQLEIYKLYINESKTNIQEKPFPTNVTCARQELLLMFTSFVDKYVITEEGEFRSISKPYKVANLFLHQFRTLAHKYSVSYDALNRHLLGLIVRLLKGTFILKIKEGTFFPDTNILLTILDISFYVYSLDMCATASFKICRIIQLSIGTMIGMSRNMKLEVEDKINREVKRCFDIYRFQDRKGDTNIEVLNILILISCLLDRKLDLSIIKDLFGLYVDKSPQCYMELNYFQICTILYVIKDEVVFHKIKEEIIREVKRRYEETHDSLKSAELAMLYFDWIVCPYIEKKDQLDIIESARKVDRKKAGEIWTEINKSNYWFFNWNKSVNLERYLTKKEYRPTYE